MLGVAGVLNEHNANSGNHFRFAAFDLGLHCCKVHFEGPPGTNRLICTGFTYLYQYVIP